MLLKSLYPTLTNKIMVVTDSILLILGQILNVICPYHLFHVNQIMLLTMLLLEFMVIKQIKTGIEELKKSIKENTSISFFYIKDRFSVASEIISFALVVLFITTMFAAGCLEPTLTGIYSGALGAVVFYIGIQAYIHYLFLLHFSFNLKNCKINDYSFYYLALTK